MENKISTREEGYYSELYKRLISEGNHGCQLNVHFFDPSVLDQYRDSPYYNFYEYRFSTKVDIPDHIEGSGIQQFVWGHKADGSPCIAALLPHLQSLSFKDQLYWQSKELSMDELKGIKIDSRYANPMLYGKFPDKISRFEAVFFYLKEIQNIFASELLFPNLPDQIPDFLAPLSYNTKRAFIRFAQDLYTILDIKPSVLAHRVNSPEKDNLVETGQKWNLMALYFREGGSLSSGIGEAINVIKEINKWRRTSAHTIQPAGKDRNYVELQKDLVYRLQKGLRVLLETFSIAETGSAKIISKRVMEVGVE